MLKVRNLVKRFGELYAVNDVSIDVPKHSIILLIGPNGSGKTTLLNCISGFLRPDKGKIIYCNVNITKKTPHEIAKMGLVRTFQIPLPFQKLTVLENLMVAYLSREDHGDENILLPFFKRKCLKRDKEALIKAFRVLKLLNLDSHYDVPANNLSGGQLKLLEIGRALMMDAKLILLDEPVGSINPVLAHQIFAHIKRLREELGITFLIVEHRLDIAMQYADYVYAMALGKIVSKGSPEEVVNDRKVVEAYLGA